MRANSEFMTIFAELRRAKLGVQGVFCLRKFSYIISSVMMASLMKSPLRVRCMCVGERASVPLSILFCAARSRCARYLCGRQLRSMPSALRSCVTMMSLYCSSSSRVSHVTTCSIALWRSALRSASDDAPYADVYCPMSQMFHWREVVPNPDGVAVMPR